MIIDTDLKSTLFSTNNEKTGEIRCTIFKREKLKIALIFSLFLRDFHVFGGPNGL